MSVALLTVIGLVMVASASSVRSIRENDGWAWAYFSRQVVAVVVGSVVALVATRIDLRRFDRTSTFAVFSSIVGLILVLLPTPISRGEVNGARRWLDIGPFDFQPSELAKLSIILWSATLLSRRQRQMGDWRMTILPVGLVTAVLCGLIIAEPDLGTVVVIAAVVGVMLVTAGARLDVLSGVGAVAFTAFAIKASTGYHADRWGFLNPLSGANDENYQLLGSLGGVASGGWFGVGPGGSKAKWGYLPEAHTDAIFAVVGEEFGFLGSVTVIALYVVLIVAGLQISRRCTDPFGRLAAMGITCWVGLQAFINIGVSLGMLPNKGFTLPFVSYGGSSQAVLLLAAGILLSASRRTS